MRIPFRSFFLLLLMTAFLGVCHVTCAQQNTVQQVDIKHYPDVQIWSPNITLPNGANYAVDLKKICSISLQKYVSRTLFLLNGSSFTPILSPAELGKDQKTVFLYADVTEMTIETLGGIPARFYFVKERKEGEMKVSILGSDATDDIKEKRQELQKLQDSILSVTNAPGQQDKKEETQSEQATMVTKDYPTTTHARNLEFRLKNEKDVENLYLDIWNKWTAPYYK